MFNHKNQISIMTQQATGITVSKESVTVDEIKNRLDSKQPDGYSKTKEQAQLRQKVIKNYPREQITNSMNDNIFSKEDFNLGQDYQYPEQRVTWIPVPKGTTKEEVEENLKSYPNATLYKILSHEPIFTNEHVQYANSNLDEEEKKAYYLNIASRQLVAPDDVPISQTGEVIEIDWDNTESVEDLPVDCQFRYIGFSADGSRQDEDRRETSANLRKQTSGRTVLGEAVAQEEEKQQVQKGDDVPY